ncbi:nitrogenase reductase domain-containing protein (plasmid) [Rhizobium phaseoli]|uniref:Uncharacterized protein n=1 Tax=Rhizobium sophoriradicis TaxID=1535245 RepID=A0A2A5KJ41_9HYPH|nr:nitrogenase reductase domain-containing protein [Rhizobium phaseoli]PCK77096.1 hypothetical protein CPT34_31945 [Rhizobium sophoriradicis]PDS93988.1 hypothetical protein CO659_31490 [Rhizobium sp. S9]PDT06863.1 hypothetical protein CO655_30140 [Rhizobium sp. M1]PDT30365.1 hypothetical protein CO671_31905 [Rhizobium sp. M10]
MAGLHQFARKRGDRQVHGLSRYSHCPCRPRKADSTPRLILNSKARDTVLHLAANRLVEGGVRGETYRHWTIATGISLVKRFSSSPPALPAACRCCCGRPVSRGHVIRPGQVASPQVPSAAPF